MHFKRPSPEELRVGLAALRYLAQDERDQLTASQHDMLAALQRVFGTRHDVDRIEPLGPAEAAARLDDPQIRQQILSALIVFSLIDGEPSERAAELVDLYAYAFGVEEKSVANLRQVARRQHITLRLDVLRRFWAIDKLLGRMKTEGIGAAVRVVRAAAGRFEDPALARRFEALRCLPEGTLGREYIRYLKDHGWPLPGELGAQSDIIVQHDLTHILGGYGTDPAGEVEVACFSAGHRHKEPFTFVLFVLLQFHVGVRMTPGARAEHGFFDVERALLALERGAAMNVDLSADWDYWAVVDVPVEELRRRYAISPRQELEAERMARQAGGG
jgi:hypothetical protein